MGQALETIRTWFAQPDPTLFDDEIDWYVPGYPVARERYRGRAAVVEEFMPAMRAHFTTWIIEGNEFVEAGDRVTVAGQYRAVTRAGTEATIRFLHLWTVRDGRITAVIAAADTALFSTLGLT